MSEFNLNSEAIITPVPDDGSIVDRLAQVLQLNCGVPATQKQLASALGVSVREIQDAIQTLRTAHGVPICGGDWGMWLAQSRDEAEAMIRQLWERAMTQLTTVSGMKKGLDEYYPEEEFEPVQDSLFDSLFDFAGVR